MVCVVDVSINKIFDSVHLQSVNRMREFFLEFAEFLPKKHYIKAVATIRLHSSIVFQWVYIRTFLINDLLGCIFRIVYKSIQ